MIKLLKQASFAYCLAITCTLLYRAVILEQTATYQDVTFCLLTYWWLITILITPNDAKLAKFAPHCVAVVIPLMYVVDQRSWLNQLSGGNLIDKFLQTTLTDLDLVIKSGTPDNFNPYITTFDLYTYLFTTQLVVIILLLMFGTLKAKGVGKYIPKTKKKKK